MLVKYSSEILHTIIGAQLGLISSPSSNHAYKNSGTNGDNGQREVKAAVAFKNAQVGLP